MKHVTLRIVGIVGIGHCQHVTYGAKSRDCILHRGVSRILCQTRPHWHNGFENLSCILCFLESDQDLLDSGF